MKQNKFDLQQTVALLGAFIVVSPWFSMLFDFLWWMLTEQHFLNIYQESKRDRLYLFIGGPIVCLLALRFITWLDE